MIMQKFEVNAKPVITMSNHKNEQWSQKMDQA